MIITLHIPDKESADLLEKAVGGVGLAIVDAQDIYATHALTRIPQFIQQYRTTRKTRCGNPECVICEDLS